MNWIRNFVKPKLKMLVSKEVPDNLWSTCQSCSQMIFHRELRENQHVCPHCDYHMRLGSQDRLDALFDKATYQLIDLPETPKDPIKFKDLKKYSERHKEAQTKTGLKDALQLGYGTVAGQRTVIIAMDFAFMGGSMGLAVGEGIVKGAQFAQEKNAALIMIPASGGARMQEGILSLMQMARTTAAINRLKEDGLPYIVVLTDPTTGGVTASFAMLGDIHIAEPKAMICFAGRRVIEQTIKEKLPEGFQTAEYLLEHGMIDMVVHRRDLKKKLGIVLNHLMSNVGNKSRAG
jgi:acetyl-CoA carboxylase carboxyl transferase subunit beta